jgi:hypothetical protein
MHGGRAMLAMEHAPVADYGRNRVFENQLFLAIVLEKHGILIEGPNLPGKLDAADQIYRDWGLVLANRIQEGVLNVLCRLIFHLPISLLSSSVWVRLERENVGKNKSARTPTVEPSPSNPAM